MSLKLDGLDMVHLFGALLILIIKNILKTKFLIKPKVKETIKDFHIFLI
jgi:hypothetical protein